MTTTTFEKALVRACMRAIAAAPVAIHECTDRLASAFGATVKRIAAEAKVSVPQARRRLDTLQQAGKAMRYDHEGGSTTWWPVGLTGLHKPSVIVPAAGPRTDVQFHGCTSAASAGRQADVALRQTLTTIAAAPAQREAWWEVLGVAQDDSFRDCTAAYRHQLAEIMGDTDANEAEANAAMQRLKTAYDGAAKAHEVQVTE